MLMPDALPNLQPKLAEWMRRVIGNPAMAFQELAARGSPLNLQSIGPFRENLHLFSEVLSATLDRWEIFYACKANRSSEFVATAIEAGYGVDTGSIAEFRQAIELGAKPEKVIVTSAVKSEALVDATITAGSLVVLDNFDELELVAARAHELNKAANVGLRLSGFPHEKGFLYSRFGFACCELPEVMAKLSKHKHTLGLSGVQFHLNGYSLEERLSALDFIFSQPDFFKPGGSSLQFVDIGGGIPVCYLESENEWNGFQLALQQAVLGNRTPVTFGNNGLGYVPSGDKLLGTPAVYPFWNSLSKERYLAKLLSSALSDGRTVAQHFNSNKAQFRCELGRALLDQCGATVARVMFRKPAADGRTFVGLDMNYTQLTSSSVDFLLDPQLLSAQAANSGAVEVYLVGNYCLERDLILKRAVSLPSMPNVGDLVLFPNTAAYLMHLHENGGHLTPLAQSVFC